MATADGGVRFVQPACNERVLQAIVPRDGREEFSFSDLNEKK
jgi:hypothetical protein